MKKLLNVTYSQVWRSYSWTMLGCRWEWWHGLVVFNKRWYLHILSFQILFYDRVNQRVVLKHTRKGK